MSEASGGGVVRAGPPARAVDLLGRARDLLREGAVGAAWAVCLEAAAVGRADGDAALVADAATLVPVSAAGAWELTARQHALCREALAILGDGDPVRSARVRAQLTATVNPFTRPLPGDPPRDVAEEPPPDGAAFDESDTSDVDVPGRFLRLQARHAELIGAQHARRRLTLADDVLLLAATATSEHVEQAQQYLAWGHLYRLESLYQLGLRVELDAEVMSLTAVVRRLDDPVWTWRLLTVRASLALLEGDYAGAGRVLDQARELGASCGLEEAFFIDLVLRSRLAVLTGEGLAEVEPTVRSVLAGAPFFARGWHATVLLAMGRREEAGELWRALAAHLDAMPRNAHEWLIATVGHAQLCAELGDGDQARVLYGLLLPFDGLYAIGSPQTPGYGPVSYHLGRLAAQAGDVAAARSHLTAAVAHCEAMHAPVSAASARAALGRLSVAAGPLTAREHEIAGLVADGLTNREIAAALFLSERTVETHVSHVLRKLDLPSRSAVVRWMMSR